MKTFARQIRQAAPSTCMALLAMFACAPAMADTVYTVKQTFTVKDVPADAKNVRGWFWMPEDRPEQRVLEFRVVEAPQSFRITRDPRYGRSWLHAESTGRGQPLRVAPSTSAEPFPSDQLSWSRVSCRF